MICAAVQKLAVRPDRRLEPSGVGAVKETEICNLREFAMSLLGTVVSGRRFSFSGQSLCRGDGRRSSWRTSSGAFALSSSAASEGAAASLNPGFIFLSLIWAWEFLSVCGRRFGLSDSAAIIKAVDAGFTGICRLIMLPVDPGHPHGAPAWLEPDR